jgi:5'-nucleotidase
VITVEIAINEWVINLEKLSILLTNDDGFSAEGLQALYLQLKELAVVAIVAPDQERSAVGHGITMHQPLRATPVGDNIDHWMVNGTPADCVKLALEYLVKDHSPDLIISGINRGPNLGCDILYSGTVSAAIEGSFYKIPSLAASLAGYGQLDFAPAAAFIANNLHQLKELATAAILNLNFPTATPGAAYQGISFTKLGLRAYQNVFEARTDPRGQIYFWMGGEPINLEQEKDSDIKAIDDGYISITPLHTDLTDIRFLENHGADSTKISLV